ncbi:MAG: DMT family transporter [Chlamydiia bacterium]|nr:DMT family transporter [Chlamydiia bacterium]
MGLFAIFLTFFIWSTSFPLGKATLEHSPPLFLTGVRMMIAGVIILTLVFFFRKKDFKVKKKQLLPLFLLSISSIYLTNALEFWGLQYLTAAKACFIYSLSPFMTALLSYFQFKEKMTAKKWLGLLVGFFGFVPVLIAQSGIEELVGGVFFLSWAEIALIGATLTSVYGWVLLRKLGKEEGISPLMANGISMLVGGVFAFIHSTLVENWSEGPPIVGAGGFFKGIFLMIVISNLICCNLYGWLLKQFTATFLSFAGLTTPLFAAFFGYVLLGESVDSIFFLSLGIIAVGLWLVYNEELRLGYMAKPVLKRLYTQSK